MEPQVAIQKSEGEAGAQEAPQQPQGQVPEGQQQPPQGQPQQAPEAGTPEPTWTPEQKAYVEKLRQEAGNYRTKAKELDSQVSTLNNRFSQLEGGLKQLFGGEGENLTPEQKVEQLTQHNAALEMQSAITEAALAMGVTGEDFEYFSFLLNKEADALEEGEEMTEDAIAEIAQRARRGAGQASATSVQGQEAQAPSVPGAGEVSLESFSAMTMSEKSELYQKNPQLYQSLAQQARKAGKLI